MNLSWVTLEEARELIRGFRLIDDIFMVKVFEDKECAELLLKIVLNQDGLSLQSVQNAPLLKRIIYPSFNSTIRATDYSGNIYNIEVKSEDANMLAMWARYNSSLIVANTTDHDEGVEILPESYVIFITENDVRGGKRPIYRFERIDTETGEWLEDGAHVLYVNSQVQDDTPLGRLMHDFYCTSPNDMYYSQLAERSKYFKETEEGESILCRAVDQLFESKSSKIRAQIWDEAEKCGASSIQWKMIKKMFKMGMSLDDISQISELPVPEVIRICIAKD